MARAATFGLVAFLALAPVALASHPSWQIVRKSNLDSDRTLERVIVRYDTSFDHKIQRASIIAVDSCAGRDRLHALAAPGRAMDRRQVFGADALGRPGVAFSMSYADGHWVARVVQLRAKRKGACPTPVKLFDYSSTRPPYAVPQGYTVGGVTVQPGEHSASFAGKELVLTEEYSSPEMNPVRKLRRTYLRFASAKRRYVPYRTELVPPG